MRDEPNDKIALESQIGMCLVDEQGLIVEWSPGQEEITGLTRLEALGRSIWDVQYQFMDESTRTAEEYGRLKNVFAIILSTGQVPANLRLIEIPIRRSDGTRSTLQLTASAIKTAAGYMLSCLFRDATAQNRLELAYQEARTEAELANRAKGQFLARMSHEIRTPLHGIAGLTDVLSNTSLTAEQKRYLDMIRSSADLLLEIVNDILDFSKIESGRLELEETPFDLYSVVDRAGDAVALQACQKGIELVVDISPATPAKLIGDPARLQQVLVNLLNNAVKFTEKGQVVLCVRPESEQAEMVTCTISVEDTGIGIAQDKLGLIFEAFRQSDGSTTRRHGGTGLGLSIASQLVGLMGGRIEVESKLNQGSRFHFRLACKRQPSFGNSELRSEWRDVRVLLIDDNPAARLALEQDLVAWGMSVMTAENAEMGSRALEMASADGRPFSLVLLDSTLPDSAGLSAAAAIGRQSPGVSLIILLQSAYLHDDIERYRQIGVASWLPKPVKYHDLRRAVETILGAGENLQSASGGDGLRPGVHGPSRRRLKILLADDNHVGLLIGEWMLKALGHTVETASDGRQVLDKFETGEYDLILLDLEMPQVDGWQALRIILQREVDWGLVHTPILAVTADASKEIRDAALQAGMDGYLFKPFSIERLQETIEPFIALAGLPPVSAVFDRSTALEAVGGSDEILAEVLEIFVQEDYPRHLRELKAVIDAQDGEGIRKAAHGLKGPLATFGAHSAAEAALQLQEIGARGEIYLAPGKMDELEREVERFVASASLSSNASTPSGVRSILETE